MKKNGKYCNGKKGFNMQPLAVLLALTLLVGCAIGGTIAWLTAQSEEVENTFTVGNIDIKLEETKEDFKMVPGNTIEKDPVATVLKGSEASWLFVRVEESRNLSSFIEYAIADGWTEYTDADSIPTIKYYYRQVDDLTDEKSQDSSFAVLKDNQVQVKEEVTKQMMDSLTDDVLPKLIFAAAAVQQANVDTVDFAWEKLPADFKI